MAVHRSSTAFLVTLVVVLLAGGIAAAQEATPIALPVAPDPAACQVTPREPVQVLTSRGTPEPWPTVASEEAPPAGQPADPDGIAAVTEVEHEILARGNALDLLRAYALLTEDSAVRMVTAGAVGALGYLDVSKPLVLLDVRDVRVLPDGRLGAIVVWQIPIFDATEIDTLFHVYEQVDGQWRLDEETVVGEILVTPVPATPVP